MTASRIPSPTVSTTRPRRKPRTRTGAASWGLAAGIALATLAMVVPAVTGWVVHAQFPPLHAQWRPRLGIGTAPAVLVAVVGASWAHQAAFRLPLPRLLAAAYLMCLGWMLSLALVDGVDGVARILDSAYEYLDTARATSDISATLHEYVARIPLSHPHNWPPHVAGHPPGALLFFVLLVRLGLGSGLAAGLVVTALAATTPLAVMVTLRALGQEPAGRRALPFLVLGPAAIWQSVSADAMFAAVAAWGLAALALAATRRRAGWALLAGGLLGYSVMLSYGLPLLGVLALAVLVVARSWFPLPFAAAAAVAVVMAFAAFGFAWWEAFPVLHARYWDGIAHRRPTTYWLWGDLAALVFSAGPMLGSALAASGSEMVAALKRPRAHPVGALVAATATAVLLADVSLMSKGEVERIWLPFVPWLLLSCAFLPRRWARWGLVVQVVFALVVEHLIWSEW